MTRLAVAALLVLAAVLAPAASAHVTVIPAAARPGETAALRLRVLNERAGASTVRVELFVPDGTPVELGRRPGWDASVARGHIVWTAGSAGAAIGGGSAKDFPLTLGPLPKLDRLVFKALQHYSDGTVVRWIQDPRPDAERPAPTLALTASGRAGGDGGSSAIGWVVIAAVLVAVTGGAAVLVRRRRQTR